MIKVGRVVHLGGHGFTFGTRQEKWNYVGECINLEIFSDFDNLMNGKLQVNINLKHFGLRYYAKLLKVLQEYTKECLGVKRWYKL